MGVSCLEKFKKRAITLLLFSMAATIITFGLNWKFNTRPGNQENNTIRIGLSVDTLIAERWQRDRDIFVARAKELGAEVIVQNANNDIQEQIEQLKYLINQNIDVLVIIPNDADKIAPLAQAAKKRGIKVISYDRLIKNANVDMYISIDNVKVGELMAKSIVEASPEGNYIIVNGAPIDNNSFMYNEGYYKVLKGPIAEGHINVIEEIWAENWYQENAFKCVENVLQQGSKVHGIIAANDSLAEGVIMALAEKKLAGSIPVVGADADLSACQRVVEGTQLMTIYKPIKDLAQTAADISVKLAKGEKFAANSAIYDGRNTVPYHMLQPIAVSSQNMKETVIQDGFHRAEDIYRNIPKLSSE